MQAWPVAFYAHSRATEPVVRRLSWDALARALTTFRPDERAKPDCPMWSPVRLVEGATRRLAASVESVSCVVLDYDSGIAPEVARAPWMPYRHLVHTSYSHTADVPKYRVVVPLASPVPASAWLRVWHWASGLAGGANDGACKDVGRAYFLPVARGPHWAEVNGGPLLDVVPSRLPPAPGERTTTAPPRRPPRPVGGDDGRAFAHVLAVDPVARASLAGMLDARIYDGPPRRATHLRCPACGEPSAWYYIDITAMRSARCKHLKSCGWYGSLAELTGALNAP